MRQVLAHDQQQFPPAQPLFQNRPTRLFHTRYWPAVFAARAPDEALRRMHAAMVTDIGSVDPDAMTFGRFTRIELVEALNAAVSCVDEGGYFTVSCGDVEMLVAFEGRK
jgi:hypothetical protein